MINAIHNQTDKPRYNGLKTWENSNAIDHSREPKDDDRPHIVTIDIETTAETPQSPIFNIAYDEEAHKVYIGQDYRYTPDELKDPERVKEIVREEFNGFDDNLTIEHSFNAEKQYMANILDDIQKFNETYENEHKGIVGHNIYFDLGILGSPEPQILNFEQVNDEWEGAISYNEWSLLHKRAGASGRMYSFREKLVPRKIEVIDTMAVGKSIRMGSKLSDIADNLDIEYIDVENEEHGVLNEKYIRYNANDVIATHKIAKKQREVIAENFNSDINLSKIYSSASISKEKMREMGYDRTHYTEKAVKIASAPYFGGNTEALIKGDIVEDVDYTDILSEYPTVSALTNVWEYMRAEKVYVDDVDAKDLPEVDLEKLKNKEFWEDISKYYVVVDVDGAIFPIRTQAGDTNTTSVYKAKITTDDPIIYHYMDVVGAMLYGDGEINIKKAFKMEYEGKQDLENAEIGGTKIDANDNLMKRIIEERKRIQAENKENDIGNAEGKNENTLALKIIANALYGVSAERLVKQIKEDGEIKERYDEAGTYYNPHTATTITAGGRLLLTIGEVIADNNGGQMYYCDTDSLIIDSGVSRDVRRYFNDHLNPYDGEAGELDVLEIETENNTHLSNIKYFGWDVKKYAIMNRENEIITAKQHGLGHYKQMRNNKPRIKRFWSSLMATVGFNIGNDTLSADEKETLVTWQTSASTEGVRDQMSNLTGKQIRYGDFIERTISVEDGKIAIYIGTSLDQGKAIKIIKEDAEVHSIEVVDNIEKENLKTIEDVVFDWSLNNLENGRNEYKIVGTQKVTKEATDVKDIWDTVILDAFDKTKEMDFSLFTTDQEKHQIRLEQDFIRETNGKGLEDFM